MSGAPYPLWRLASSVAAMVMVMGTAAGPASGGPALEQSSAPVACDSPQHHQLDFWLGDWQVFDTTSRQLVAFDRVEKGYEGCIITETLTFLTDTYRRPGAGVRLAGIALNRFDGERWLQMWADNQWGGIVLHGAPNPAGNMEFVTVIPSRGRDVKLLYEKHGDGTLRILQYVAPAGSGKWVKYGDLDYRRNR
jgi:hypothetical protein